MIVLWVLLGSLILFRLLGSGGVPLFSTWHESTAYALAVLFCFTGAAHFGPMRTELEKMVPPWVPNPKRAVWVTGLLEILGATDRVRQRPTGFTFLTRAVVLRRETVRFPVGHGP